MAAHIKDNIKMTKNTDMAYLHGQMADAMKVIGREANSMDKENMSLTMAK